MSNWGQPRPKKPRPQHGPAHMLEARYEEILKEDRNMPKHYKQPGEAPSRDTVLFNSDPERQSIDVPKAAMLLNQAGYPLDHENYPMIKKFNSEFPSADYYFVHGSPVVWKHNPEFHHIPTYSRYVVDKYGRVLNAANGTVVKPEEGGYNYKLVSDGFAGLNNPWFVSKRALVILAFHALPENFVDYGTGTYSHFLTIDNKSGAFAWVARPEVKVRDNKSGRTTQYRNLPEFLMCAVSDFGVKTELRDYVRNGINEDMVTAGQYNIKQLVPEGQTLSILHIPDNAPTLNVTLAGQGTPESTDTPTEAPAQETASTTTEADIDFTNFDF